MASSMGDSRRNKKAKAQAEKDLETNKTVIVALMSTLDGRRWMWLRLSESMLFQADTQLELGVMAWRAGMRNAGLRLLQDVTSFTPDMYVRMTKENTSVALQEEEDERIGPDD
jgi:hypothetical protein